MNSSAPLQTVAAKPLRRVGANLILQRKCACGAGASSLTGECALCGKKKLGPQAKLRINEPGDVYEQEADRVAEQVTGEPAPASMLATAMPRVAAAEAQRAPRDREVSDESLDESESALTSGGAPLPAALRSFYRAALRP